MSQVIATVIGFAFIVLFVGGYFWDKKKKAEYKNPLTRHKVTPIAEYFVKDLPPNFYVSPWFCAGFAGAAFVLVVLVKAFFPNFTW